MQIGKQNTYQIESGTTKRHKIVCRYKIICMYTCFLSMAHKEWSIDQRLQKDVMSFSIWQKSATITFKTQEK